MPFKLTGTTSTGAKRLEFVDAKAALKGLLDFEKRGFQKIVVKDDPGRTISRDELTMLVYPDG